MKTLKNIRAGVKEVANNYTAAYKGNRKAKADNKVLATKKALKQHNLTPSIVRDGYDSIRAPKNVREYDKTRKAYIKAGKKRLML